MAAMEEHDGQRETVHWLSMRALAAPLFACLLLAGCSTVTDVWEGTTDAVGSLFGGDDDELAEEAEEGYPDLAGVPEDAPETSDAERADATEGLIADRSQAQYTEQVRRRDPMDVRPLQDGDAASVPAADEPPPPQAAPVAEVTPVDTAPRSRPSLAERLGATPPPPPPASAESAPPPPPVPPISSMDTASGAPSPATTVIGGTDTTAPSQLAALPNAMSTYDPSAYRVSTHVATITFPTGSSRLTSGDRQVLDDVIRLHRQYGGAVRVIGHASSRTQNLDPMRHKLVNFRVSMNRANSVASALMGKGIEADRLFVGAVSDNEPLYYEVMPAGESGNQRAEIFIDY